MLESWPESWTLYNYHYPWVSLFYLDGQMSVHEGLQEFFELTEEQAEKIFEFDSAKSTRTIGDAINDIRSVLYAE